jgi:hypothetical protein
MPFKDPEQRKLYIKEYNEKNREKNREKKKEYYELNKEQIKEKINTYRANNKEKYKEYIKEYNKKYHQTEGGKKAKRIAQWKQIGVINDDYNALHDHYINCKNCEECNIELIQGIFGTNKRCLDHDHQTGKFRNVLCHLCNVRRG